LRCADPVSATSDAAKMLHVTLGGLLAAEVEREFCEAGVSVIRSVP
jgi:hypothetical protein